MAKKIDSTEKRHDEDDLRCQDIAVSTGERCKRAGKHEDDGDWICTIHKRKRERDRQGISRRRPLSHESHCGVCQDPRRDEMEQLYVEHSFPASRIAKLYGHKVATMQRHVRYTELDVQRATNALPYLGRMMQRSQAAEPSARDGILAAWYAFKISGGMEKFMIEGLEQIRDQVLRLILPVFERLDLEPEQYHLAADILERKLAELDFDGIDILTGDDDETQH